MNPYPIDKAGTIIRFSKELDTAGQATFRLHALDTMLSTYGDIIQPHVNWLQIIKNGNVVWLGAIIDNKRRSKDFIECTAVEPLWYLDKILINRTSADPSGAGQSANATSFTMSGTSATIAVTFPTGIKPVVNGSIILSGFADNSTSGTAVNGTWPITAVGSNSVTVTITGGPYTASTLGTVIFSNSIYRVFSSGTMDQAVSAIMNETVTNFQANNGGHPLSSMTIGTISNPSYPPNMVSGETPPKDLNGPWTFGDGTKAPKLLFDFNSVLYVLHQFGAYTYSDFYLDNNLVFNFVPFKGRNLTNQVTFSFSPNGVGQTPGNIVDYNIPRLGERQINSLYGIATDVNGNVLNYPQQDSASVATYGFLQSVAAYSDVKDQATLNARIQAELPLISTPDSAAITITQSEKGYPLGTYDVGDVVSIKIKNKGVSFSDNRRIVGITVVVNGTGREMISIQTNKVLPFQQALISGQNNTSTQ